MITCDEGFLSTGDGAISCHTGQIEANTCEIFCSDNTACNYNQFGACFVPPEFYGCDGQCINDEDNDGLCDEYEEATFVSSASVEEDDVSAVVAVIAESLNLDINE